MSNYERYQELLTIWQSSGAWRRFSFEEFIMELYKLLKECKDKPDQGELNFN
jgi:hypothetical protein